MKFHLLIAGVDEAGRGSVLGPLVVAGISIEEEKIPALIRLGVKDSKLLTPKKRALLFREIKKLASAVNYEKIQPPSIDEVVLRGERLFRLNYLEARHMARVLARLDFEYAYVDCCDTNQSRFGMLLADLLLRERTKTAGKRKKGTSKSGNVGAFSFKPGEGNPLKHEIRTEHHADRNYPVVSAASIVAKVIRDMSIKRLYALHGPFGSGYPSDPQTVEFLRHFIATSKNLPRFTRLSWATIARISIEEKGRVVDDFTGKSEA